MHLFKPAGLPRPGFALEGLKNSTRMEHQLKKKKKKKIARVKVIFVEDYIKCQTKIFHHKYWTFLCLQFLLKKSYSSKSGQI